MKNLQLTSDILYLRTGTYDFSSFVILGALWTPGVQMWAFYILCILTNDKLAA